LAELADAGERAGLAALAADYFGADAHACDEAGLRLLRLPAVAAVAHDSDPVHGSTAGQVALKRLTSELVSRFASAAVDATRAAHGPGPLGRYAADLVVPQMVAAEVALLKAVAVRYVMKDPARLLMQAGQREMITELVHSVADGAPDTLGPPLREAWADSGDDGARWRVVVDQVATLTDQQACDWHRRLVRKA
jgi:dGTPase